MLLRHSLGLHAEAQAVEHAVSQALDGGRLTVDLDADDQILLDIQPPKKSDKPRAEAAAA